MKDQLKEDIGSLQKADFKQLTNFKQEILGLIEISTRKENIEKCIAELIRTGTELDQLFSYAKISGWSFDVTETLFTCYGIWTLGLGRLLGSEYGEKKKLRMTYPSFCANDGVTSTATQTLKPTIKLEADGKTIHEFSGVKVPFKGLRYGEQHNGRCVTNKEGARQIRSAHESLRKKVENLSELFKRDFVNKLYIEKVGDHYKYDGKLLVITTDTNYYNVFDTLYALIPEGGRVGYKELGILVKKRIPSLKDCFQDKLITFMQTNLTDEHNGFLHYAKIPLILPNGKKIIRSIRGEGFEFNNHVES